MAEGHMRQAQTEENLYRLRVRYTTFHNRESHADTRSITTSHRRSFLPIRFSLPQKLQDRLGENGRRFEGEEVAGAPDHGQPDVGVPLIEPVRPFDSEQWIVRRPQNLSWSLSSFRGN